MNKFITFTLVLLASATYGQCGSGVGYGVGPAVQQVSLSALPNIQNYLNGASTAYGPSPAYVASSGPAASVSYSATPASAPYAALAPSSYAAQAALSKASSVVLPSASSYAAAAPAPNGAPAPYAAPPKIFIQPAYATQLYPGQQNYKAYVSPPQHSQVALPILPSDPVAKLFEYQQSSHPAPAPAPQPVYSGSY